MRGDKEWGVYSKECGLALGAKPTLLADRSVFPRYLSQYPCPVPLTLAFQTKVVDEAGEDTDVLLQPSIGIP